MTEQAHVNRRGFGWRIAAAAVLSSTLWAAESGAVSSPVDPSFGTDGWVRTNFREGVGLVGILSAAGQQDGKILLLGQNGKYVSTNLGSTRGLSVVRLHSDGTPDKAFNGTGEAILEPGGCAKCLALQPDGRILVAHGSYPVLVTRLLPDGTLDKSFNGTGQASFIVENIQSSAAGVAVQADGRIVVATGYPYSVVRFKADGSRDASFGTAGDGMVRPSVTSPLTGIALQADGRILLQGTSSLARLNADGSLDAGFNGTGIAPLADFSIGTMAALPDGRILVAGGCRKAGETEGDSCLARLLPSGLPDAAFGEAGRRVTAIGAATGDDAVAALLVQADGKVVAGGQVSTPSGSNGAATVEFALARYSAEGLLDSTFNGTGILTIPSGGGSGGGIAALVGVDDGKIMVAGGNGYRGALIRVSGDGTVDPAFGPAGSGRLWMEGESSDWPFAVGFRADGSLVVGGTSDGSFALAAYGPDGALRGKNALNAGVPGSASSGGRIGLIVQPDDRVVLAGTGNAGQGSGFTLMRFDANLNLDPTFGGTGRVVTTFAIDGVPTPAYAHSVARQADGKLVAAGWAQLADGADAIALARYNADGSADATFGAEGRVITRLGGGGSIAALALAVQPDGRIVVVGAKSVTRDPLQWQFALARYRADGSLDTDFGNGGIAASLPTTLQGIATAIALQPDGRVVVTGPVISNADRVFVVGRYLPNGTIDSSFGAGGVSATPMGIATYSFPGAAFGANSLALQADGRVLVGGSSVLAGGSFYDTREVFAMARLEAGGALDPNFGTGGRIFVPPPAGGTTAWDGSRYVGGATAFVLAGDGRVVMAGNAREDSWDFDLVRIFTETPQEIVFGPLPDRVLGNPPLTVSAAGGESGNPVVFGSATPAVCTATGANGATITLTAAGTCTIVANQAASTGFRAATAVSRSFTVHATGFLLSIGRVGSGTGTVTSDPSGISCGATCGHAFAPGIAVTLKATPDAGYLFGGWGGACAGTAECSVRLDAARTVTASFVVAAEVPRLANISTRGRVGTGDDVLIGGFVISGTSPKRVLVTARGPTLAASGITGALANPKLEIYSGNTRIHENDDWRTNANVNDIAATGIAPLYDAESALLLTLPPGAYTAVASGVGGSTGIAIVEVFEQGQPEAPLANISTRGRVEVGDGVMIGGIIIQGSAPKSVLITARGPSLIAWGITNPLANPKLEIFSGQTKIYENDNWQTQNAAAGGSTAVSAIQALGVAPYGLAPSDSNEAALLITLPPGAYTAIVSGADGGTGVGIVEVFAR